MTEYTLYYWPIPFRGQFVRAVLAHAGASWHEADIKTLTEEKSLDPAAQLVPHMGPPVLVDHRAGLSLAQTAAILAYLGDKYALVPNDAARTALTSKLVADASDILYEMTLHHGAQMWTDERWHAYRPRLARWMAIFETHGRQHGLAAGKGHMLGTDLPSVADIVAHVLWGYMTSALPPLRPLFETTAPAIASLSDRIALLPEQARLRQQCDRDYGAVWCGGEIEASLRDVL